MSATRRWQAIRKVCDDMNFNALRYTVLCDGMRGLMQALSPCPVQMCLFHQMLIVRRYLTQDPDLEATQTLLRLVNGMTRMDRESFVGAFEQWAETYWEVLQERIPGRRYKRPPYRRSRLRSTYPSLKRNMRWLWTFYDYDDRVIPNTNNGIEGVWGDIKAKVRVHSGLIREHRTHRRISVKALLTPSYHPFF